MKLRSILFSLIICIGLAGPGLLCASETLLKADLPGWLSAEDADYLLGGKEKAGVKKNLSIKGFQSKKLQASLETAINNYIPMRYSALLANGTMQRSVIAASNLLYGFEAYPTFYGSPSAYVPQYDSIVALPNNTEKQVKKALESVDGIKSIAEEFPEKNFYLILADRSQTSLSNPIHKLMSHSITTQDYLDGMGEQLLGIENVHIVCVPYDSLSTYYESYYRSDHHWNGYGTILAYEKLRSIADLPYKPQQPLQWQTFNDYVTNGSYARDGLMLINQVVTEPIFDLEGFDIENKNVPPIAMSNGEEELLSRGLQGTFNFYSQWYGSANMTAKSPISFKDAPQDKQALIICDSYGNSMHWLIARNYSYTKCFRDIWAGAKGDDTLRQRIASTEADDVYFIGGPDAYTRLLDSFPHYFD